MKEHELSPVKREFLARLMAAPAAERTAMMRLMIRWKNGAGPDKAAVKVWFYNKVAEIEARGKAGRPAVS
jgi:hypothetical protein